MLPPGDLRMALAALAGDRARPTRGGRELLQHRFGGAGALAGHPVGNLLLTGLLERGATRSTRSPRSADLVGAVGRVLPMSPVPLDLVAEVDRFDPDDPDRARHDPRPVLDRGDAGRVRDDPAAAAGAPACAAAVDAIREADVVVLGPGFVVHQRDPAPVAARTGRGARRRRAARVVSP